MNKSAPATQSINPLFYHERSYSIGSYSSYGDSKNNLAGALVLNKVKQ